VQQRFHSGIEARAAQAARGVLDFESPEDFIHVLASNSLTAGPYRTLYQ
jgi:hypothetical protein